MINKNTFEFLKELKANNNRDWFQENKAKYDLARENFIDFADALLLELKKTDNLESESGKKSIYRIYRDIRFSKDKTPYKTYLSGHFKRATNLLRGGYYFHIEPGNTVIAGGFWGPSSEDILRIRKEIAADASEMRAIINAPEFINTFGELKGDKLKSAPRGFDKNHPDLDLLQFKQYLLVTKFDDKDVFSKDFYLKANEVYKKMRPFFDYFSEVLTTDENGASLYD